MFPGKHGYNSLTLGLELSEEAHMLTKQKKKKDFIEKWHPSREKQGKGTQENCSDTWVAV